MKTLICIDRDGTLIYDSKEHLFLGSQDDWKGKVEPLPNIREGLRKLNALDDAHVYMITNQSGIAVKELPKLTEAKAHEVCKYVIGLINGGDCLIEDYFLCPHVEPTYFETHPQYHPVNDFVFSCDCIKPRLGMVTSALEKEGFDLSETNIFVIGDRLSDAMTAVNAGGTGILVPFENETGEKEKAQGLENIHIAEDFLDACELIVSLNEDS